MEEEFVPYELALKLKELEFNEVCLTYYNFDGKIERSDDWAFGVDMEHKRDRNQCLAPLWQQAFDWFRDKYYLHSCIVLPINKIDYAYEIKNISENIRQDFLSEMQSGIIYSSYEGAELACIRKLIEIVKKQNVK